MIGFLLFGAILPGIALRLFGRRSAFANQTVIVWGLISLLAFFGYVFFSGGGV